MTKKCQVCFKDFDERVEDHILIISPRTNEYSAAHWNCMLDKIAETVINVDKRFAANTRFES